MVGRAVSYGAGYTVRAHRALFVCLNPCRVRGDDDGSGIDYVCIFIIHIGYDVRDIVPMLIMFPINNHTHMCDTRMISPIEISSRFICIHSFAKNHFMLYSFSKKKTSTKYICVYQHTISNIQSNEINKQFKFSSFEM